MTTNGTGRPASRRSPLYGEAGYHRLPGDTYDTIDPRVVTALLTALPTVTNWSAWEAAAGRGSLSDLLRIRGCRILAETDIAPRHTRIGFLDFFAAERLPVGVTAILTNPPFDRIAEFARHALRLTEPAGGQVVLLARHEWICAAGRADLTSHPAFDAILTLRFRPFWTTSKHASPRHNFAWLLWRWDRPPGPPRLLFSGSSHRTGAAADDGSES